MAINLNSAPYFDDFSEGKKFQRILFKPGVAVQARELTQLQSILSNQVSQLGTYVLREGTIVSGCKEDLADIDWIKINDTDINGIDLADETLAGYVNAIVVGRTTGIQAKVLEVATGTQAEAPDTKTFYIRYTSGDTTGTYQVFQPGEVLDIYSNTSSLNNSTVVVGSSTGVSENSYYGKSRKITLSPGLIYINGAFVQSNQISTYLHRYSHEDKLINVGFTLYEEIINSGEDSSLLDPAAGSYNENAPGADRLRYTIGLTSFTTNVRGADTGIIQPENFVQYGQYQFGSPTVVQTKTDPFNALGKELAKRTYNESGDYVVRGLKVTVQEHLNDGENSGFFTSAEGGDATKLLVNIDAGEAVVAGYPRRLEQTKRIEINKSTEYKYVEGASIGTAYGNYVLANEVYGLFDVDGGGRVDLLDTAPGFITSGTSTGSVVGKARVRHIALEEGTPGLASAKYRIYLYDIQMLNGPFTSVRGLHFDHAQTDGYADLILEDTTGDGTPDSAVLKENSFNKMLWKLPYNAVKNMATDNGGYDYSFIYSREFDVTADSSGNVELDISSSSTQYNLPNDTFPYSSFTQTVIEDNFLAVAREQVILGGITYAAGEHIDLSGATFTLNSSKHITINLGVLTGSANQVRVYANLQHIDGTPASKSLQSDKIVTFNVAAHPKGIGGPWSLGVADGFQIKSVYASANSNFSSPIDVTNQFTMDNGQKDSFYGHAKLVKKKTASVNLSTYPYLQVTFDYFSHSYSTASFFCINSYPVDDTGATGIKTEEIPLYKSKYFGNMDLRDCIDFRPMMQSTVTPTSTLAGAPLNPSEVEIIFRPNTGLTNPIPTEQFTTDLEYYLGRNAIIVLDEHGEFRVIESAYSASPKFPQTPEASMKLASFNLPQYPCLSAKAAKRLNRYDYDIVVKQSDNRRFTMRDIGVLEKRIKNLEYYTTLTLLEKAAESLQITNANSGLNRFKNGILVDNFTGHSVGAVEDPDYHCSMDFKKKHLRPYFYSESLDADMDWTNTTAQTAWAWESGDSGLWATIPYEGTRLTANMFASQPKNLVSELLFNYRGTCTLSPSVDNWVDTDTAPEVSVEFSGNYDAWKKMEDAFGTQWGDWEDVGAMTKVETDRETITRQVDNATGGSDSFITYTTSQNQTRSGTTIDVSEGGLESYSLGNMVVDTSILGYMRPRVIHFHLKNMKPNTRVYPFFDGVNVSQYCGATARLKEGGVPKPQTPIRLSGQSVDTGQYATFAAEDPATMALPGTDRTWVYPNPGGSLVTDSVGSLYGYFRVPAGVFQTGVRVMMFTDDSLNRDRFTTTSCEATFQSSGMSQTKQNTIVSTRTVNVTKNTVTDDRVVTDKVYEYVAGGGVPLPPPEIIPNPIPIPNYVPWPVTTVIFEPATFDPDLDWTRIDPPPRTHTLCFIAGTEILMAENGVKPIEEIEAGDKVAGISGLAGKHYTVNTVVKVHHIAEAPQDIFQINGVGGVTPGHPFMTTDGWKSINPDITKEIGVYEQYNLEVSKLEVGDRIISIELDGTVSEKEVTSIQWMGLQTVKVYNFETDGSHNYVANGMVAHNKTTQQPVPPPAGPADPPPATPEPPVATPEPPAATPEPPVIPPAPAQTPWSFVIPDLSIRIWDDLWIGGGERGWGWGYQDPLAQTFRVSGESGGVFLRDVQLYFRTVPDPAYEWAEVTLQIREVVNGVPGEKVLGSCTMSNWEITPSEESEGGAVQFVPSMFRFNKPVYLLNETEYCFVPIPANNNPGWEIWISELGEFQVGTETRIAKQPHNGIMFTSANNVSWTPQQSLDMMFAINKCSFEVGSGRELHIRNATRDYIKLSDPSKYNSIQPRHMIHTVKASVTSPGAGYTSTPTITVESVFDGTNKGVTLEAVVDTVTGEMTGVNVISAGTETVAWWDNLTATVTGGGATQDATVDIFVVNGDIIQVHPLREYLEVETWSINSFTGYIGGAANDVAFEPGDKIMIGPWFGTSDITNDEIESIDSRYIDALALSKSIVEPPGTSVQAYYKLRDTAGTQDSNWTAFELGRTEELLERRMVRSISNIYTSEGDNADARDVAVKLVLSTNNPNVSPLLDTLQLNQLIFKNDIDDVYTNEDQRSGGDARSRYITRKVILDEGQDAEDLNVYLSNSLPAGTDVKVYGKFLNGQDSGELFEDAYWIPLQLQGDLARENSNVTGAQQDYVYSIPEKAPGDSYGLNPTSLKFEYDVDVIDSITLSTPGVGYTSQPSVTIEHSGNGYGATAVANVNTATGLVTGIDIVNPGRGYTGGTVTVTISGGGASVDATATASQTTITYTSYKEFAVKIVPISSQPAKVPTIKELRAIALQA